MVQKSPLLKRENTYLNIQKENQPFCGLNIQRLRPGNLHIRERIFLGKNIYHFPELFSQRTWYQQAAKVIALVY